MSQGEGAGRPPTHGLWSLERSIEARRIDPALERELIESARDMLADDGGTWERQPARRRAIAERLAILRLLLQTADAYLLKHGLLDGEGQARGVLKIYVGLTNAFGRAATQLGLDRLSPDNVPALSDYIAENEKEKGRSTNGNQPASDAAPATQADTPTDAATPHGEPGEKNGL